ncbi:hypothetical protein QVD17_11746 [Tagetes erecta]|uniref:Uncharacterized protein n=1 Tax=Tagetes erecta TaxID=13708 RepID=A0AAD8L1C0_TARER|nr:hypothetical protein QVD17_11746 [Tagetes erecta]
MVSVDFASIIFLFRYWFLLLVINNKGTKLVILVKESVVYILVNVLYNSVSIDIHMSSIRFERVTLWLEPHKPG